MKIKSSYTPNRSLPICCGEDKFYVYLYIDPRNGNPFYVGKGKGNNMYRKKHSREAKEKISKANKGKYVGQLNPNAKKYEVISPSGKTYIVFGEIRKFCLRHEGITYYGVLKILKGEVTNWRGWTLNLMD